jgi:hypothetical protein
VAASHGVLPKVRKFFPGLAKIAIEVVHGCGELGDQVRTCMCSLEYRRTAQKLMINGRQAAECATVKWRVPEENTKQRGIFVAAFDQGSLATLHF